MKGVVYKSTGSNYVVKTDNNVFYYCTIKGNLRIKNIKTTNPVVVGDEVNIIADNHNFTGTISEVLPRKNYIIRKSVNLSRQAHIIASNIDLAVLFFTIKNPETPLGFIDRFLVTAEAYAIPVLILFHKTDIYNAEENQVIQALIKQYTNIGYPCMQTSVSHPKSLQELAQAFSFKTVLLSGNSGVGKSSVINALNPQLNVRVGEISDYHLKGQHTTTFAEMFDLNNNTRIIDTPGIKGFGVIDMDKTELSHFFPEMRKLMHQCRFNNCTHINEPACAVKQALQQGHIWQARYENYLSIYYDDEEETYRGKGY